MRLIYAMIALALSNAAEAQDQPLASQLNYYSQTSGGEDALCGMDFSILYLDRTYKSGAPAALRGSLAWIPGKKGDLGVLLKVIGADFAASTSTKSNAFKISSGFLAIDGNPVKPSAFVCDDQAYFCGMYWLPHSVNQYFALAESKLSIGFNREASGLDIVLPIIGSAVDQGGFSAFNTCMIHLMERLKANPK